MNTRPTPENNRLTNAMNGKDDAEHLIALDELSRRLERERDELREYKADIENATLGALDETCGNERHCACVPLLRVEVKRLLAELADTINHPNPKDAE